MSKILKYSIPLVSCFIAFYIMGNPVSSPAGDIRSLSTFPNLLALIPFPVVLYLLLKREVERRAESTFSFSHGLRMGEAVVRWAAIAFAAFTMIYSYFYFAPGPGTSHLVLVSGIMTLVATWLIGVAIAAICSYIVVKQMPGDNAAPAA